LHTAVTALGDSSLLLDVEVSESATGGLDDADLVGLCRVADILVRPLLQRIGCLLKILTQSACGR
jgi:hypothetical protein